MTTIEVAAMSVSFVHRPLSSHMYVHMHIQTHTQKDTHTCAVPVPGSGRGAVSLCRGSLSCGWSLPYLPASAQSWLRFKARFPR